MIRISFRIVLFLFIGIYLTNCSTDDLSEDIDPGSVDPNMFSGTDTDRIQAAIRYASQSSMNVSISLNNLRDSSFWLIDRAILVPSNIKIYLDNCHLKLSDQSRDNMFRSDNFNVSNTSIEWNSNIEIIGIGNTTLSGADNPRSTGDLYRILKTDPIPAIQNDERVSYGSDADNPNEKHTGDWRNNMIIMNYVNNFVLENVKIRNAHAWAISLERVKNAAIRDIMFDCPSNQIVNGKEVFIANRDGLDLRHGCHNIQIENLSGVTGDDFIALSILDTDITDNYDFLNSSMLTSTKWTGDGDNITNVHISNIECEPKTRAIAIRANERASINNVFASNIQSKGGFNTFLIGGRGFGPNSQPGKINNIHIEEFVGEGSFSLIQVEERIADCTITNGIYEESESPIIIYEHVRHWETSNVRLSNITRR